jgi:catechol 2,3-dioxygenase-like lactoylglutathione lyase family enzyme
MGTSHANVRRAGVVGVHSLDRFTMSVPEADAAERFYRAFGLDVRRNGDALELYAFGDPHCWGVVRGNGAPKQLQHLRFGIFAEDRPRFAERIAKRGIGRAPPQGSNEPGGGDDDGLWLSDVDGVPIELVVADKCTPDAKCAAVAAAALPAGQGAAPARSAIATVRPRRLSHVLRFTPDVPRMVRFCTEVLGLRLSDYSGEVIAFLHGAHGSDHHILAFAKAETPGFHHSSWDVGSIDDVGCGAEQMRNAGYTEGWGVGRHVIGSNYFYYVRDPWRSWAEYSFDIDYVPANVDWPAADHPVEDSIYVWGPPMHPEFIVNFEGARS